MSDFTRYDSPLASRYASDEMSYLFSPRFKHITWRRLWLALAKSEQKLGLPITPAQIAALEEHLERIDFVRAHEIEQEVHHDVMAHILLFGEQAPEAKPILHLGATSAFVTDNTDLIQMREGLKLLQSKLVAAIRHLAHFAQEYAGLICLSYTHFQPAQPTTVGKRACLWLQDLLSDLHELEQGITTLRFLGVKGATGTQASFYNLFNHDAAKVKRLDELVAQEMHFSQLYNITSQTYPRKQDIKIFAILTGIAVSAHKFATDLRLLAHLKEIEEPFGTHQVGSSAMPYKRNPMRSERICALARYLMNSMQNPIHTAANQWLERTLDDSANRRIAIAEGFLTADAILNLLVDLTANLVVYPKLIDKHLQAEMPFLASESIIAAAVQKGKDRQIIHERLRLHSLTASRNIKIEGKSDHFIEEVAKDPQIGLLEAELASALSQEHIAGLAQQQVAHFLEQEVNPVLRKYHR